MLPLFPDVKTIRLDRVCFPAQTSDTRLRLAQFCHAGERPALERVEINKCINVDAEYVDKLRGFVREVVWDGHVEYRDE